MEGSDETSQFYAEARKGLVHGLSNALILHSNASEESIQSAIRFGSGVDLREEEVKTAIASQLNEIHEKNENYKTSSMYTLAAMHHAESIIQEVTLLSELASSRDVSNICANILKRCFCQKESLEEMLEHLHTSSDLPNVSDIDASAREQINSWIEAAPWQRGDANAVTEDESKDTEVQSDASYSEEKKGSAEAKTYGSEAEKFDGAEKKGYDSEEDEADAEEKNDHNSCDETKKDPEQGGNGKEESTVGVEENESVGNNRGSGDGGSGGSDSNDCGSTANAVGGGLQSDRAVDPELTTLAECDKLSRLLEQSGDRSLIISEFGALRTIYRIIEHIFDPQELRLHLLAPMTQCFIDSVFGPLSKFNKILAIWMRSNAKRSEAVPDISTEKTYGEMLCSLEKAEKKLERATELEKWVEEEFSRLTEALYDFRGNRRAIADSTVQETIRPGRALQNVMWLLLHLCTFDVIIDNQTVYVIYDDPTVLKRARDLASQFNADFNFDQTTTIKVYIVEILYPALAANIPLATHVMCDLRKYIAPTRWDDGERAKKLLRPFVLANSKGGGIGKQDYCGHRSKTTPRRCILITGFSLIGQLAIRRRLGDDMMFSERGGIVRGLCRLSNKQIDTFCSKFVDWKFYEGAPKSNDIEKIRTKAVKETKDCDKKFHSGCINIIIENQEQIESLRSLVDKSMSRQP